MNNKTLLCLIVHSIAALTLTSFSYAQEEKTPWRGPQPVYGKPWPTDAHLYHRYWFQMGEEFGNPITNNRFRVIDPYVATHPEFHSRKEPKGNGMMLIPFPEVIREIDAARLYLELWGGHPHTDNRRVSINGRTTYSISAPVKDQCTQIYREMFLKRTDLVQGYNALQFNVDGDNTFWGHFIVEEAAIDALLPNTDTRLKPLQSFVESPTSIQIDLSQKDKVKLSWPIDNEQSSKVARVHYYAKYDGYDENGDGISLDWHGMTKRKLPIGHLGTVDKAPYLVEWDTSMIKAQTGVQVRAVVEVQGSSEQVESENILQAQGKRYWKASGLCFQTSSSEPFSISHPDGIEVVIIPCENRSVPFWSRANKIKRCEFPLSIPTDTIERAKLSVAVWDGGAGTIVNYFQLNGHSLPIAGDGKHDAIYTTNEVDTTWLQPGVNHATLVSDTKEHGIEILHPGPALTIRYKVKESQNIKGNQK